MLSKFLITLLVIAAAFIVIRSRNLKASGSPSARETATKKAAKTAASSELSKDMRIGAYLFLALTIAIGGAVYFYQWQDDHSIVTVKLYRNSTDEPVSYEVYKFQLGDKSFITTEGLSVAVAGSERMEVLGLKQ